MLDPLTLLALGLCVDPRRVWFAPQNVCVGIHGFNGLKDSGPHQKFGVQIQPIAEYSRNFQGPCGRMFAALVMRPTPSSRPKRCRIKIARDRPYDIWPHDWFNVATGTVHRTSKRFWCSAFVAFILTRAGVCKHRLVIVHVLTYRLRQGRKSLCMVKTLLYQSNIIGF